MEKKSTILNIKILRMPTVFKSKLIIYRIYKLPRKSQAHINDSMERMTRKLKDGETVKPNERQNPTRENDKQVHLPPTQSRPSDSRRVV